MQPNSHGLVLVRLAAWMLLACGLFVLLGERSAQAQFFGFSGDGVIAYSASKDGVSGGTFGITHPIPFVPNIGGTGFFFQRRKNGSAGSSVDSKIKVTMGNLFYNIPVPVFSLSIGGGGGIADIVTDIVQIGGKVEEVRVKTAAGEGFVRLGLPFLNFIDFHVGYHFVSIPEVDIVKDSETQVEGIIKKINFSGSLTTLGLQLAF